MPDAEWFSVELQKSVSRIRMVAITTAYRSHATPVDSSYIQCKKALVFTNDIGGYLVPKRVYLHFRAIADAIGATEARVHDLRHTYAVLSLQNGDDIKTVQTNMGHASAAFTLDVYGHVSDRMQRESADRMQRYITDIRKQPYA